jgi:RNA polymerase-binding transcription factor DksA
MKNFEKAEKTLRARLAVLAEKVETIDEELEAPGDDDFEEMAVESQSDEVLEGVGHAANEEIRDIQIALKRIAEGTYGKCQGCEKAIPEKRLEAVPHANLCVECEALSEESA